MRDIFWTAGPWLVALALCQGCGASVSPESAHGGGPARSWSDPRGRALLFDPGISPGDEARLRSDYQFMESRRFQFPAGREADLFGKVFGGAEKGSSVVDYLSLRVRSFVPALSDSELEERLQFGRAGYSVMANNLGAALWIYSKSIDTHPVVFHLGDRALEMKSPRVGLVELGSGYSDSRSGAVMRSATLVHEGRHSDCSTQLSAEDHARLRRGQNPEDPRCTHSHADCPSGHPLAGLPACDSHPWGAYSVEMIYGLGLEAGCVNCSESDRLEARATALDAASRVMVLEEMLSGSLGEPEMGSVQ